MDDQLTETPAQVHGPTDETGQALIAMLQRAAKVLEENSGRAAALVHRLSSELEASNDRINELEADVELFRDRAAGAERWLQQIHKEIETRLMRTF